MRKSNTIYSFVDGAYLRRLARDASRPLPQPRALVIGAMGRSSMAEWCSSDPLRASTVWISHLTYYDARPDEGQPVSENLKTYWEAIELLNDCDLGFGALRGRSRRQKGVDTLIAVDMLSGAFDRIFDVAILVAGDADFVPVVQEVRRRGIMVGLIGEPASTSDDLIRACDRFQALEPIRDDNVFPPFNSPARGGFWNAE